MVNALKNMQSLTAHPVAMLIPYIKDTNATFHQIFPLLSFEPILSARLQKNLMRDLL